jgi:hypothetical protein
MKLFVVLGLLVVISNGVIVSANYRRCKRRLHAEGPSQGARDR